MNFQPITIGIELPEETFEPISFADVNPSEEALSIVSITENNYVCANMTHKPQICSSKLKSVRNRPAVVRYREHLGADGMSELPTRAVEGA